MIAFGSPGTGPGFKDSYETYSDFVQCLEMYQRGNYKTIHEDRTKKNSVRHVFTCDHCKLFRLILRKKCIARQHRTAPSPSPSVVSLATPSNSESCSSEAKIDPTPRRWIIDRENSTLWHGNMDDNSGLIQHCIGVYKPSKVEKFL